MIPCTKTLTAAPPGTRIPSSEAPKKGSSAKISPSAQAVLGHFAIGHRERRRFLEMVGVKLWHLWVMTVMTSCITLLYFEYWIQTVWWQNRASKDLIVGHVWSPIIRFCWEHISNQVCIDSFLPLNPAKMPIKNAPMLHNNPRIRRLNEQLGLFDSIKKNMLNHLKCDLSICLTILNQGNQFQPHCTTGFFIFPSLETGHDIEAPRVPAHTPLATPSAQLSAARQWGSCSSPPWLCSSHGLAFKTAMIHREFHQP